MAALPGNAVAEGGVEVDKGDMEVAEETAATTGTGKVANNVPVASGTTNADGSGGAGGGAKKKKKGKR